MPSLNTYTYPFETVKFQGSSYVIGYEPGLKHIGKLTRKEEASNTNALLAASLRVKPLGNTDLNPALLTLR